MAYINGIYVAPHVDQFDGSTFGDENCTPTTGANGANTTSGGKLNLTGASVRKLVARWEETNPATPGWSLPDLELAMSRVVSRTGVVAAEFINRGGQGWTALMTALGLLQYVALQGDSDQFGNNTCSGAFNGDHCIGIHPATRVVFGRRQHWIDDPICPTGRWEFDSVIHNYAAKLNPNIQFGVWTHPVPRAVAPKPPVPTGDVVNQPELPNGNIPMVVDVNATTLYKDSNCTIKAGTLDARRTLPLLYKYPGFGKGHWCVVHGGVPFYVLDSAFVPNSSRPA